MHTPLFCLFFFICLIGNAWGHGAVWTLENPEDTRAVTLRFLYSSGEPTSYAAVIVSTPGENLEHQNGFTDKNGRFSFVPDAPGDWLVDLDDGMGHKVFAEIAIAADGVALPTADENTPAFPLAESMLGLSLLANLTMMYLLLRRR